MGQKSKIWWILILTYIVNITLGWTRYFRDAKVPNTMPPNEANSVDKCMTILGITPTVLTQPTVRIYWVLHVGTDFRDRRLLWKNSNLATLIQLSWSFSKCGNMFLRKEMVRCVSHQKKP